MIRVSHDFPENATHLSNETKMMTTRTVLLTFVLAAVGCACGVVGCGKKNPVDVVSAAQSGVEVVERDFTDLADEWFQWRGPGRDGIAPDQDVVTSWDDQRNVLWRVDVPGRGHSSPVVVDDLVMLATATKQKGRAQMVLAYDRVSGESIWECVVFPDGLPDDNRIHPKATHANSSVVCDGDQIYASFFNGDGIHVVAIDREGEIVWRREVGKFVSKFGYAPSPVLYQSLVIVAADNSGGGYLVALDTQTGEVAWRTKRGNADSYSSPMIASVGGRDQLLLTGGDRLASYDPATGELIREVDCISEATCGTVVVLDDNIYASGGYPEKETVCVSAGGERVWSNRTKIYEPSMIGFEGHLFGVTDDGIAYCWDAAEGDERWKKRLGGNFSSSPVICNGNLFVANLAGDCFVFRASGDGYSSVAKNRLGNDCYASPAIVGGHLFFRVGVGGGGDRREQLVCVGSNE